MRNIALLLGSTLMFGAAGADAATLIRDYQLNGSYADALGGADINPLGDVVLGAAGVRFDAGEGLQLNLSLSTYSVESVFRFDTTGGYKRVYDFLNRSSDSGLYFLDGSMNFYPVVGASGAALVANTPLRVVFTRAADQRVTGYVNGAQQITFVDSTGLADIGSVLTFFADNSGGGFGGEQSAGFVDSVRIYDDALSANDVAALGGPGGAVPEPATWAMLMLGFGLIGVAARRRRHFARA